MKEDDKTRRERRKKKEMRRMERKKDGGKDIDLVECGQSAITLNPAALNVSTRVAEAVLYLCVAQCSVRRVHDARERERERER